MNAAQLAVVVLVLVASGCDGRLGVVHGTRRATPDGGVPTASEGVSSAGPSIAGSREICGNGVDDDGNGQVDEGCACSPGDSRSCYIGPPGTENVGICHSGMQNCDSAGEFSAWGSCTGSVVPSSHEIADNGLDDNCDGAVDEAGGVCVPVGAHEFPTTCGDHHDNDCDTLVDCADPDCHGSAGCPSTCAATETLCVGGIDDDCDTLVDCADPDCAAAAACAPSPCGPGETPTYHIRALPPSGGGSSVEAGDGGSTMPMTCEPSSCDPGFDSVESSPGTMVCVPRAPTCAPGTFANYTGSGWTCAPGCDYIVHYGGIYGGQTVCAGPPPPCDGGLTPTWVYETGTWECRSMCDGGLYDPHVVGGVTVCVPC